MSKGSRIFKVCQFMDPEIALFLRFLDPVMFSFLGKVRGAEISYKTCEEKPIQAKPSNLSMFWLISQPHEFRLIYYLLRFGQGHCILSTKCEPNVG